MYLKLEKESEFCQNCFVFVCANVFRVYWERNASIFLKINFNLDSFCKEFPKFSIYFWLNFELLVLIVMICILLAVFCLLKKKLIKTYLLKIQQSFLN